MARLLILLGIILLFIIRFWIFATETITLLMTAKGKHPILYVHKDTNICSNILIHTHTPLQSLQFSEV